ncbi:MAG: hypothetical protein ACR2OZ_07265 [Verrucomicrobiales bacterium]
MKSLPRLLPRLVAFALVGYANQANSTTVSGTLSPPGSLTMIAPAAYVSGVPMLVRVDLKDSAGNLDRAAWNRTVNLSASNGVTVSPNTIAITNGMGSVLVTFGGGASTTTQTIFSYGTYPATPGSTWKYKTDFTEATLATFITDFGSTWKNEGFDDSSWITGPSQIGYGDTPRDEQTLVTRVDYSSAANTQSGPAYLFRNTFTIADVSALTTVVGEVKFDDSCAVYVNGTQVYRHGDLTQSAALTEYTETTTTATRENATAAITVPLSLLHNGVNTIAVEVHQHDAASSDLTFDLRLQSQVTIPAADPGNFTLTASVGGISAAKALISLAGTAPTEVSGALPTGVTTWSGLINVTGDVTVPAGATLNIQPGTHVLVAGTPFLLGTQAVDSNGTDIIVNGTLQALGSAADPISLTCSNAANRWGELRFANGSQPSALQFCLLSRAGHSPSAGGHIPNSGGTTLLLNNNVLTIDDCVLADGVGKTIANTGNPNLAIRRTQIARFTMGPEIGGTTLLLEDSNITDMLPIYRERGGPDDEDCIYIHSSGGRPVNLRRTVLANCGDDALDLLAGDLTVEDCIIRNAFDKGVSALENNAVIRRTLIVDNDIGVSAKSRDSTPRSINLENVTVVGEEHPLNTDDGVEHSVGIHTRNKPGQGDPDAVININLKNCIIVAHAPILLDAPYPPANTVATYTCTYDDNTPGAPSWPGTGNIAANPQFVDLAGKDFRLGAASPARDTGDPASPLDADGSRADMGALPFGAGGSESDEVHWTLAGSPYHVVANATVPAGLTLRVEPGVLVHFNQNVQLVVRGLLLAEGTAASRIVFSHLPGAIATGDADPVKNGTQTGAPKWGGVRIYDSMAQENLVRHCEFINAQGTSLSGSENYGSLGFIRSWGLVEYCTWTGTHLRMCYGRNPKLTVQHCIFPDMFVFDPVLGREENPNDFLAAANNNQEHLKVEFPTGDTELSGNPNFTDGQPVGGWWRIYYNDFYGNKGHNDVFDGDSGRWGQPGQLVIDCRYNYFHGLAGDEHIDLGGDAYVASNIFERGHKDPWGTDFRYSSAISSGDRGTGTTIMVARNLFFDLDHGINLSQNTGTIFEHNTVANLHPDFLYTIGAQTQTVEDSVVNFFIPEDGPNPTYGDGAYLGFNIISNVPHMFSGPDERKVGGVVVNDITTKIEFFHNLLDQITDPVIGPNHPAGLFSGTYGPNTAGAPGFVDPANKNYSLGPGSPAKGRAPGGIDYGATVPEWAYILGGPPSHTPSASARFTVGGPGIVAYKWRLNGGAWSAPIQIGAGGSFPRGATLTTRQATLNLSGLAAGPQILEVLGQDMSGNWQDADPAKTYNNLPQFGPTARIWTVYTSLELLSDNDRDGVVALTEFALGMDPTSSSGRDGPSALPTVTTTPEGYLAMHLAIPENIDAAQSHGRPEIIYTIQASSDLLSWSPVATKSTNAAWSGSALVTLSSAVNGLVPVTVQDMTAVTNHHFMRLVVTFAP